MTDAQIDELLLRRYLDDWAYQANVRKTLASQLDWIAGDGRYEALNGKRDEAAQDCAQLLTFFARQNLPAFTGRDKMQVKFPWNRIFEADISFGGR